MPRLSRGETKRVSIKLSAEAKNRITAASLNMSVSQASLIMFALSEQFEKGITKNQLLGMESKIILEREHFPISMPIHLFNKVEQYTEEFDMKKNAFIGLLVSDYLESYKEIEQYKDYEPLEKRIKEKRLSITIHKHLKEMIYAYAEKTYVNVSFIIQQSIQNGKYKGIPALPGNEKELITISLAPFIYDMAMDEAKNLGVPLHFYIESCLFNAFMSENKIFKKD